MRKRPGLPKVSATVRGAAAMENLYRQFSPGRQLAAQILVVAATISLLASAEEPAFFAGPEFEPSFTERLKAGQLALLRPIVRGTVAQATRVAKSKTLSMLLEDRPYAAMIRKAALDAALDPALVHAVILIESNYDHEARSPMGAVGLMQVMPETALRYGVADPAQSAAANLRAGTRYLRDLMQRFNGRLELVLAAYQAGENAVLRHGERIPPYKSTQLYVPAVLDKYYELRPPAPLPLLPESHGVSVAQHSVTVDPSDASFQR